MTFGVNGMVEWKGLTGEEAARRLERFGPNEIREVPVPAGRRILKKFFAPVPCLLELAMVLELLLEDYLQSAIIGALLLFNVVLGLYKERQVRSVLEALKSELAPVASVRRDGVWQSVCTRTLVPGDIVGLSMGYVVGADVRLLEGSVLLDHSMLTGESIPVEGGPGTESYAGALVRRGEAVAEVVATGRNTRFGRVAGLIRTARVGSTQEKAVLHLVRNLTFFNGLIVCFLLTAAFFLGISLQDVVPLVLTALLAAIPVALPATFTLARVIGARELAKKGVLTAELAAIDEAAAMDVICLDKTGTLTRNELSVTEVLAEPGFDESRVLALAALASSDSGLDTVDAAVRRAAACCPGQGDSLRLVRFVPFDPDRKMSEAVVADGDGRLLKIVKGAAGKVAALARNGEKVLPVAQTLAARGFRVLALGIGHDGVFEVAGLVALSDPPRPDSPELVAALNRNGVRTVMVTGDAPETAAAIARQVGIGGPVCGAGFSLEEAGIGACAVFAGVLPEEKFRIVDMFQKAGHAVGMCGDGTNDAPALRLARIGIAVSGATDVTRSAAGIVLMRPGLNGILAIVREGRVTFQRMLTYTLRITALKLQQLMFLAVGLLMTGHAVLSPMLMVLLMMTGDFLAMSAAADNVRPSGRPESWRIRSLTMAASVIALCNLLFCSLVLAFGVFWFGLNRDSLITLSVVSLVFTRNGLVFVMREREALWRSLPGGWLLVTSAADVCLFMALATCGVLMAPVSFGLVAGMFAAECIFVFVLDAIKVRVFRYFGLFLPVR